MKIRPPTVTSNWTMKIHPSKQKSVVNNDRSFRFLVDSTLFFPIKGYCFARCQQQFAACLLAQMNEVVGGSLDFCQVRSNSCQKHCLEDKRTSQVAEANWAKVVKVLRQFNTYPTNDDEKKN